MNLWYYSFVLALSLFLLYIFKNLYIYMYMYIRFFSIIFQKWNNIIYLLILRDDASGIEQWSYLSVHWSCSLYMMGNRRDILCKLHFAHEQITWLKIRSFIKIDQWNHLSMHWSCSLHMMGDRREIFFESLFLGNTFYDIMRFLRLTYGITWVCTEVVLCR